MDKVIKIIVFAVIFIGLAIYFWNQMPSFFSTGSPGGTSIFSKGFSFLTSTSTGSISLPGWGITSPPSFSGSGSNSGLFGYYSNSNAISNFQIPQGFTRNQLSPYFKKIRVSSISASSYTQRFQFQIYSSLASYERVNITGWQIKTDRGFINIPQAINVYHPYNISPESDIVISGTSVVNIYSHQGAIGKNLRLNKCIGYLENNARFDPSLPQNCPAPFSRGEILNLAGYCQDYILSLGSCRLPDVKYYNSLPGNDEGNACREFLSKISHNFCYDRHSNDLDFLSNQWLVWLNNDASQRLMFDPVHDIVHLFDKQGLLVDEYIY
jgi:hypothetical protein